MDTLRNQVSIFGALPSSMAGAWWSLVREDRDNLGVLDCIQTWIGGVMASISASKAEDQGSTPCRSVYFKVVV